IIDLYGLLLKRPDIQIVITVEPREYHWLEEEYPMFVRLFEPILLKTQNSREQVRILESTLTRLNQSYRIVVPNPLLASIIEYAERFPVLGQLPRAGVIVLDESLAAAAGAGAKDLTKGDIEKIIAAKI